MFSRFPFVRRIFIISFPIFCSFSSGDCLKGARSLPMIVLRAPFDVNVPPRFSTTFPEAVVRLFFIYSKALLKFQRRGL